MGNHTRIKRDGSKSIHNKARIPVNLWVDLVAIADHTYYKHFEDISTWYQLDNFSTKVQTTHLVETFVAHVINGVKRFKFAVKAAGLGNAHTV